MPNKPSYEQLENRLSELEYENRNLNKLYEAVQSEISNRKRAEEALKETLTRMELALKGADLGLWDYNILSEEWIFDERSIELLGAYPKNDAEMHALIHPDDLERYTDTWDAVRAGRESSYIFEYRAKNPSGKYKWLMDKGKIVERDSHGEPTRATGTLQDITKQKQTEEKLRESEKRSRAWLESSPVCTKIVDLDFNLQYMSAAGIMGLKVDDITQFYGKPYPFYFFPESFRKLMVGNLEKVKETGKIIEQEGSVVDINRNALWFHSTLVPVNDEKGRIDYIIVVSSDITARKKAEQALKESEDKLRQLQKMEAIGTLAGGIAHDFNNILFPIVGCTEMLMEDIPEDSPLRNNLNAVFKGAMRAKELVKQILAFSSQGSHEIKLMRMQSVIKEALKFIRSTIPASIEIKQYISSDCGPIKADPTQIHQVVINLATNAYHAMEDTGGKLKVNLKEIELFKEDLPDPDMEPGPYACLKVTDTGTGIDEEIRGKIFDPYFTTKKQGKGTGMGLAVIHGIVQSAGGNIQVFSKPGQGTEFHVYLPVVISSSGQQEPHTKEPVQHGTEQLLLVDDEDAIVSMEKQMLERMGYSVVSFTSSVEALEAFQANPDKFDLVITDMAMPNMSGDKLTSELLKIRSNIPIVLCTGFSEKIPEEKAKSMGIQGFLMKPIVMKDLSDMIREVLDKKSA